MADHPSLPDRIYFGGGGGASTSLTGLSPSGGNGGGIVIIVTETIIGSGGKILSNGTNGGTAVANGGAGGGGAGGSIALSLNNFTDQLHWSFMPREEMEEIIPEYLVKEVEVVADSYMSIPLFPQEL